VQLVQQALSAYLFRLYLLEYYLVLQELIPGLVLQE